MAGELDHCWRSCCGAWTITCGKCNERHVVPILPCATKHLARVTVTALGWLLADGEILCPVCKPFPTPGPAGAGAGANGAAVKEVPDGQA